MSDIVSFEGFDGKVRTTEDGRYSVYDVIAFCGKGSQREVWKRLGKEYPEVVTLCDNHKFEGSGQRLTPVANREGILQIIGLLPGAIGRAYRAEAAKVFVQYLDADPELVGSIIDRSTEDQLKWIEARLKGKQIRNASMAIAQKHGVTTDKGFAACTNATYRGAFGADAATLKAQRGLARKAKLRDSFDMVELAAVGMAEALATDTIIHEDLQGQAACEDAFFDGGTEVSDIIRRHRQRRLNKAQNS